MLRSVQWLRLNPRQFECAAKTTDLIATEIKHGNFVSACRVGRAFVERQSRTHLRGADEFTRAVPAEVHEGHGKRPVSKPLPYAVGIADHEGERGRSHRAAVR